MFIHDQTNSDFFQMNLEQINRRSINIVIQNDEN